MIKVYLLLAAGFLGLSSTPVAGAQERPCASEIQTGADWKNATPCIEGKIREKLQRPRDPTLYFNGQGFFADNGRFVITAAHVVAGCQYFALIDLNGSEVGAGLVFWDSRRDIAILRADGSAPIMRVGARLASPPKTKPVGKVQIPVIDLIATFQPGSRQASRVFDRTASGPNDAPLGPEGVMVLEGETLEEGASGSPVFNASGEIVGMVSANIGLRGEDGRVASRTIAVSSNELLTALRYAQGPGNEVVAAPLSSPPPDSNPIHSLVRIRCR